MDKNILNILNKYSKKHYYITKESLVNNGFVIYGAGFHTKLNVLPVLLELGLRPKFILDKDTKYKNSSLLGIPIFTPEKILSLKNEYILLSSSHIESMIEICMTYGKQTWITPHAISNFCWTIGDLGLSYEELINTKNLVSGYSLYNEELSKNIFREHYNFHVNFSTKLFNFYDKNAYMPEDLYQKIDYSTFIDAGVYDITTLKHLKNKKYKNKTYIGFEPSKESYHNILCSLKNEKICTDNIKIYNYGVGKEEKRLYLKNENSPGATFLQSLGGNKDNKNMNMVQPIDSLNIVHPTVLKADIEGYEMEYLEGAEETIKKYHPTIMVSVYHKHHDIIDIPLYLNSLYDKYEFYLRHHSPYYDDTVLYAIPTQK